MKLNLGSGDNYRDGYVNVDLRTDCDADRICDVRELGFVESGSCDEVIAEDLLEHFPASQTDQILTEWNRVLQPGGLLVVKCPNMYALAVHIVDRENRDDLGGVEQFIQNVMGGHRWGPEGSLDAHHHNFTPTTLRLALEKNGFEYLDNDGGINMTVRARKFPA